MTTLSPTPFILASGSSIRAELLRRAQVAFTVETAHVDEDAIKSAMQAEAYFPRDIADALADAKAQKVARKHPNALVLGCDQVLALKTQAFDKPKSAAEALEQLKTLRGQQHKLFSAAVFYQDLKPIWRYTGEVRLTMRDVSDAYLDDYVTRNWPDIGNAVGAYKLEHEGVRLFSRIDGDYFNVLGLPLLEILSYLTDRGDISG